MFRLIFIVTAIIFVLSGYLLFNTFLNQSESEDGFTPPPFPSGTVEPHKLSNETIQMSLSDSETIETNNFIANGETVSDKANPGRYILTGTEKCLADGTCKHGLVSDEFQIAYSSNDDYFNVALLAEPIDEVRKKAEDYLRLRLLLSEEEMCRLRYSVKVPFFVNQFYAGVDLGFSFCPGSVELE